MKIVKFDNGKYGIRKSWFFGWRFLDLISNNYAWAMNSSFFHGSCMGTKEDVEKIYSSFKYKIVKIIDIEKPKIDKQSIMKNWEKLTCNN